KWTAKYRPSEKPQSSRVTFLQHERLIGIHDSVPIVARANKRTSRVCTPQAVNRGALHPIDQMLCQLTGWMELNYSIPRHLTMERVIVRDHPVATCQSLQQRRIGTSYAMSVQIGSCVYPQGLQLDMIIDSTQKSHLRASKSQKSALVRRGT